MLKCELEETEEESAVTPMPRVLFVDDESHVLDALREGMQRNTDRWNMSFAHSAEDALAQFEVAPFDAVVTDMGMAGMDGMLLLERIRGRRPFTGRIVLSGPMEPAVAVRCASVAHQCLSKPCNRGALERAIDASLRLSVARMNPMLKGLVGGATRLPSPPRTYFELTTAMRDPDVPFDRLAGIVERDAGLTAKILKVVSSPVFGLRYPCTRVAQGFAMLGMDTIRSLVLSAEVMASFKALPAGARLATETHHDHALMVASVAGVIAEKDAASDAFTAGLLHDVGTLLLAANQPDDLFELLDQAAEAELPPFVLERERWGITHAEVGAYLLGLWGLPAHIVQAVADHHDPLPWLPEMPSLGLLVCAADAIVREREGGNAPRLDEAKVHALGLLEALPAWRLQVEGALDAARR
jgi:putative nucleotidyltransferase with HDIG domain